jgi:chromosome segregation protein
VYLKAIEVIGFKSFADKTHLSFEPGMTCIVGPNGCGKSNVSDAVRWVLGEQSAKALRGSTMEDCIFNGTDDRKALGMAEVSLMLSECEGVLESEYNEVTITRRVFRSGEGQYFINKTPCRLKDIQRLFMGTGVGTTSYSLMEQGRIDRILSSRPEDRRTIFEEASGITKFKADKQEAIRKLDHTEANLLRLADVIREVKRQIGSLQRQAGKARRYKEFKDELRKLDIYSTKRNLQSSETNIKGMASKISSINGELESAQKEVDTVEDRRNGFHDKLLQTEREIGSFVEAASQASMKLDHMRELIQRNRQQIKEYHSFSERDSIEIDKIKSQLEKEQAALSDLDEKVATAQKEQSQADSELKDSSGRFQKHQSKVDSARASIRVIREKSVELESTISHLENRLVEINAHERSSVVARERLAVEKTQLAKVASSFEKKNKELETAQVTMREAVVECSSSVTAAKSRLKIENAALTGLLEEEASARAAIAALFARIELLRKSSTEDASASVAHTLVGDPASFGIARDKMLGVLSTHLDIEPGYVTPAQTALHSMLDAVVVADFATALKALSQFESKKEGSARIIAAGPDSTDDPTIIPEADRLIDHISCKDALRPLLQKLIGNCVVVSSASDIPSPAPEQVAYVTHAGSFVAASGCMEFRMQDSTSLAEEETKLVTTQAEMTGKGTAITECRSRIRKLEEDTEREQVDLDKKNQALAQKEGEHRVILRDSTEATDRLSVVTYELNNIQSETQTEDSDKADTSGTLEEARRERDGISSDLNERSTQLHQLESKSSELQSHVTEHRVRAGTIGHTVGHLNHERESMTARLSELGDSVDGRSSGIDSYKATIDKCSDEIRSAEGQLSGLEESVRSNGEQAETMRGDRERQVKETHRIDQLLVQKRRQLEGLHESKLELEKRHTESKVRWQNQIDRVTAEYSITIEQVLAEAEPEWEGEEPSLDATETTIAELRTKLEAMGPVNLVAIEEHKELEERYLFLTTQEADLDSAKTQLLDMIRHINRTTSEMFQTTFDQINENFLIMFRKLFDGGSAKLVLINEEDVLDCGIEIIARPPGKRLQNVSLLSGGERTMTAVALLFAIYMIKPSPFCLLDELDAALDDSNIGRFVSVLKGFLKQSQFVIITHNQHTIAGANAIYGVTMPEKGVSSFVSMRFKEAVEAAGS